MSTKYQIPDGFKIVSGGQSGADQAALDWAIAHQVDHGGWCPKGRRAEHGPIDARYQLAETPNTNYLERTEWNVRDSDATVIFTLGETLEGGSKRTAAFAEKHNKPCLHFRPRVDPKYLAPVPDSQQGRGPEHRRQSGVLGAGNLGDWWPAL